MNYVKPEIPLITSPVNLDAAIQKIQLSLGSLPWLERVYGRATTGTVTQGGKEYRQPEVYAGGGNYLILEPNNYLSAHAFFRTEGPLEFTDYTPFVNNMCRQRASIIVWANLDRIKERIPGLAYGHRFTEELKAAVLTLLRTRHGDFTLARVYETPAEVFSGYTYDHRINQTFKHPETGFRVEGVLHYLEDCPANIPGSGRLLGNTGAIKL